MNLCIFSAVASKQSLPERAATQVVERLGQADTAHCVSGYAPLVPLHARRELSFSLTLTVFGATLITAAGRRGCRLPRTRYASGLVGQSLDQPDTRYNSCHVSRSRIRRRGICCGNGHICCRHPRWLSCTALADRSRITRKSKGLRKKPRLSRYFPSPQPFTSALCILTSSHGFEIASTGLAKS